MKRMVLAVLASALALVISAFLLPVDGAPPQPYNLFGTAGSPPLPQGTRITAFVDGVDYSNGTSVYGTGGQYDVDIFGNWVTAPGQPNTPEVKEGGDLGDEIMLVAGDFATSAQVFTAKKFWTPGDVVNENLALAPSGNQPALLKIARIATRPTDAGTQYVYLCNPTASPVDASSYWLQKDVPGSFSGPTKLLTGVTVQPGGLAYVNLDGALTLVSTGDNLKLVWDNPSPGTGFGGSDIIIDRVEFNQTGGAGTLFWEPGNTVMTDAPAPGLGQEIRRSVGCGDTNNNAADFSVAAETGRPGLNTAPTVALTVPDGGQDWTGGTVHTISFTTADGQDASLAVTIELSIDRGANYPFPLDSRTRSTGAATFLWTVNLENSATARIRVCAVDSGSLSACDSSAADFTVDSARPTLDNMIPADGLMNIDVNTDIVLTFGDLPPGPQVMNRTATQNAVTISPPAGSDTRTWDGPSRTLTINPTAPLAGSTLYTVTVSCAAKDASDTGNAFAGCPRSFTFTTSVSAIAPTVDLTQPDGGEVWSGGTVHTIAWTMSDADTPGSLLVDLHYSTDSGTSYTNAIVTGLSRAQGPNTFAWPVPCINSATVRVRITASDGTLSAADASAGNFAIDCTRPTVLSTNPADMATNVRITRNLVVVFSESMNRTATQTAFTITPPPVSGIVFQWSTTTVADDTLTILHNDLVPCTTYTPTFSTGAKDRSDPGNGLATAKAWTFRTACAPQVTLTTPVGGEVWSGGLSQSVQFTATDADPIDVTVRVWVNVSTNGGVSWSPLPPTVVATGAAQTIPANIPNTDSTNALIRVTAQDLTGLDGIATSPSFTIDATAPGVASSVPSDGAGNVGVAADFTIRFSEKMNRMSAEAAISLTPAPPSGALTFAWDGAGRNVTVSHVALRTSKSYTLAVTIAAKDASLPGNALMTPYSATFTTSNVRVVVADPGGPYSGRTGETVQFDGSASTGTIDNYTWELKLPSGSVFRYGVRPVFRFGSAGTFNLTLVVRNDAAGASDEKSTTVTISAAGADFLSQFGWLLGVLIAAVVAALLFFFLIGKRRKKEERLPEAVPPQAVETVPPSAPSRAPARPLPPPPPPGPAAPAWPPTPAPARAPAPRARPTTKECPACATIVDAADAECFMCGHKF